MSFEVTDFGTNRKLMCDFLLMINTNLPPIFIVAMNWKHWAFDQFSPPDVILARSMPWPGHPVSICPFVVCPPVRHKPRLSTKHIIKYSTPHYRIGTLVIRCQRSWWNSIVVTRNWGSVYGRFYDNNLLYLGNSVRQGQVYKRLV